MQYIKSKSMSGGGDHRRRCENDLEVLAEIREWNDLSLSQQAISSISFACGSNKNNLKCCLSLSCKDSQILRNFCRDLLKTVSEKDRLIENVVKVNMKYKEKLESQSDRLKSCRRELNDLKERMPSGDHADQLTAVESRRLTERCRFLEGEVRILNEKIKRSMEEDEHRRIRSDRAFEDLFKKLGRGKVDDSVLAIIDSYERKLSKLVNSDLRCELRVESPTQNFKLLLKNYENKLDALNKKLKHLQTTNDLLRTQLQSRKSSKNCESDNVKSLEKRTLSLNRHDEFSPSTKLVDLKRMSSSACRKYLEDFCKEMEVTDLENVVPSIVALKQNSKSVELQNFCREVEGIIGTTKTATRTCRHEGLRCNRKCLLSTLEDWSDQMRHFRDLQESLKNLSQTLFPWQPVRLNDQTCSVAELVKMVDEIANNGSCRKKCKHDDLMAVDKEYLVRMVEHFQKLFDVPNANGVVARMSQLYVKLTENYNVMTNIKELLGLERSSGSLEVLDKLSKLSNSRNLDHDVGYLER